MAEKANDLTQGALRFIMLTMGSMRFQDTMKDMTQMKLDDTSADLGDRVRLLLEDGREYDGLMVDFETSEDTPSGEESLTLRLDSGIRMVFHLSKVKMCTLI